MFTQNAIDNRWHFSIFTIITDIKGYKTMNELNERENPTTKRILEENDEKVDIRKSYYKSDVLEKEIPYVNGKIHGVKKVYYEFPGALEMEIPYVNDEKHGVEKYYSISGKLLRTTEYKNNFVV